MVVAEGFWIEGKAAVNKNLMVLMFTAVLIGVAPYADAIEQAVEQSSLWDARPGVIFKKDPLGDSQEIFFDGSILFAIRAAAYAICASVAGLAAWCCTVMFLIVAKMCRDFFKG